MDLEKVESPVAGASINNALVQGEYYAGFWRRAGAALIDGVITYIFNYIIGFVIGLAALLGGDEPAVAMIYSSILCIVITWLYYALMESSNSQATLGKRALGIIVTDMNGNKISFGRASGRYFGKIISTLILCIGYFMVAFTGKKQALHDIMAGCLVIKK